MGSSVAFVITPVGAHNDNHVRLPRLFAEAGWRVSQVSHDSVHLKGNQVYLGSDSAAAFDLIWPVGFGPRQSFLDRQQLLAQIDQNKLITPAQAQMSLHGKAAWLHYGPPTAIAKDAETLAESFEDDPGEWVLKPVAASFGEDVYRIEQADEIAPLVQRAPNQYWMLQRFIPEIFRGETRTLICLDRTIGSYLRVPNHGFQANLARQGRAEKTTLDANTSALVTQVHQELIAQHVGFAAIDTVGSYLMEVNVANPGGLQTLTELYSENFGQRLLEAIYTRY